jgi:hypothetical protein
VLSLIASQLVVISSDDEKSTFFPRELPSYSDS